MIIELAFYLFSAVLIAAAAGVVFAKNPVHSVLLLILCFFNAAGLMLLLGAEFLALIMVIVYVGAVAVLFLFVVMMLDVNFEQLRKGFTKFLPFGLGVGGVLLAQLIFVFSNWPAMIVSPRQPMPDPTQVTNTEALGRILYTDYFYIFQISGIILLVAMIGAIVLTQRTRGGVLRQNIAQQTQRTREETVEMVNVAVGAGIEIPGDAK
ncbi:MAG TPA: NADH-quinone oxidoreductase subunit J [Rhodospirillaceae bacterium]|nr:NADH-quinone oxidoreductase subunit J [Rhodospirillaceae bacterium]